MDIKLDILFSIYRYKNRVISIIPITEIYDEVYHKFNLTIEERDELCKWATKFEKSKGYTKLTASQQKVIKDLICFNETGISCEVKWMPDFGEIVHTTETQNVTVTNL